MEIGTIVLPKYFNGVASSSNTQEYQHKLIANFKSIGMFAFGQMPFIVQNGPDPEKDYEWGDIDSLVEFAIKNDIEVQYNTVINSHHDIFPDWYHALSQLEKINALKRHIQAVIRRYKGKIRWFKLANESRPYPEDQFLGTNETRCTLIAEMFRWAKEEYSEGVFVLNDHVLF